MWETWVQSLGWEDPLEKGKATQSSILALRIIISNMRGGKNESESRSVSPTLCDPKDYTVHGILQARILEWVAFTFSRGSSQPRD